MSTPAEELRGLLLDTFPQSDNRAAVEWLSLDPPTGFGDGSAAG